ncbi:hypothetical protein CCP3SC1_440027 [Gammaproteobacteria bacterium]
MLRKAEDWGGGLAELSSLAGLGASLSGGRGDAVAVLSSQTLVDSFIRKNNLLKVLFPSRWDDETGAWKMGKEPTQAEAYRLFSLGMCKVNDDRKTGLVTFTVYWKDPVAAARWANDLVQEADLIRRRDAIEETERSIAFLEAELRKTSVVETQQTIQQLMEVQIKKKMFANTAGRYSYKVIDQAIVQDLKERPKRTLIVIMGTFFGLVFGVLVPWSQERYGEFRVRLRSHRQKMVNNP